MMNQVKLLRKFNCKQKLHYSSHIMLIFRVQLVFQSMVILTTCLTNFSLRFHLTEVYTTDFWVSEKVASSNFALAVSALLLILYTVKIQMITGFLIKDIHCSTIFLHFLVCFCLSNFSVSIAYVLYLSAIGGLSIILSSFASRIAQQQKLRSEIMEIESEDRKSLHSSSSLVEEPFCQSI